MISLQRLSLTLSGNNQRTVKDCTAQEDAVCACVTGFYCSNEDCDHCRPVSHCTLGKGVKVLGRFDCVLHSHLTTTKCKLETENLIPSCSDSHERHSLCSVWRRDLQQRNRFPLTLSNTYQVRLCLHHYRYYSSWRRMTMFVMWLNVTDSFISHLSTVFVSVDTHTSHVL